MSSADATWRDTVLAARLARRWPGVRAGLHRLYPEVAEQLDAVLVERVTRHVQQRTEQLFLRDLAADADPGWFQRSDQIGYVCYADRFAGSLSGIGQHLDYLGRLGVTYLHVMPVLHARHGENDGGYAVVAYDEVDPRLGSMAELGELAESLHGAGMNLCVDVVLNHTAAEHPWAVQARDGDQRYRDYYFFFPDRTMPDRYERTLREVFPTFAPGNFTWLDDAKQWVWTTFHEFQWDLNWANPEVFAEFVDIVLHLSAQGVDVLRLDAVPFLWKRLGTSCENQPEVHDVLTTLRALVAVAAPSTIFKSEAIVAPEDLIGYLGAGHPERDECDIGYNNQLMVQLWSSLAAQDTRVLGTALRRLGRIPDHAAWVNYVRCHDDIGWAIMDHDAVTAGWDGAAHRNFLNQFYSGDFAKAFGMGEVFQYNPQTGDGRISGTAASLCGIERAIADGDEVHLDLACRRLEMLYACTYAFGGIPLVYMGDEIGLRNDRGYLSDPAQRDDNRWMHRPLMDWAAAARIDQPETLEGRLFAAFVALGQARAACQALDAATTTEVVDVGNPHLLCLRRSHPVHGGFVMIANFSERYEQVAIDAAGAGGLTMVHSAAAMGADGSIMVQPYGYAWMSAVAG